MANTSSVLMTPNLPERKAKCYEQGQNDFATGKSCRENPYTLFSDREAWFKGFLNQKRIVYRSKHEKTASSSN
jgi:hypothetical protein